MQITSASMSSIDFNHEKNRLETFDTRWPHSHIEPRILAKSGLYYLHPSEPNQSNDRVKCHFCKVEIHQWRPHDNEICEHRKKSPNCPLLRNNETLNVPMSAVELDQWIQPIISYDVFATHPLDRTPSSSLSNTVVERKRKTLKNPAYPQYESKTRRFNSFSDWSSLVKQTPQQLSDAGFFYTGVGDIVKCFCCGGRLGGWGNREPWERHALWYGNCEYVHLFKGAEYVRRVKTKYFSLLKNKNYVEQPFLTSTPIKSQSRGGAKRFGLKLSLK